MKLSKGKYEEEDLGHGPRIEYRIRTVGLYLVIESSIGLAVMWDRKTSIRILLQPEHSVSARNDRNVSAVQALRGGHSSRGWHH